jgi:hypothetical protein
MQKKVHRRIFMNVRANQILEMMSFPYSVPLNPSHSRNFILFDCISLDNKIEFQCKSLLMSFHTLVLTIFDLYFLN